MSEVGLGIDVGGTGVKAALVELVGGELLSSRVKLLTPDPATPEVVAATIREVVDMVDAEHALPADVPVGCGLPGPIKGGRPSSWLARPSADECTRSTMPTRPEWPRCSSAPAAGKRARYCF
jgi:polyphosphate glucokinase